MTDNCNTIYAEDICVDIYKKIKDLKDKNINITISKKDQR